MRIKKNQLRGIKYIFWAAKGAECRDLKAEVESQEKKKKGQGPWHEGKNGALRGFYNPAAYQQSTNSEIHRFSQ